MDLVALQILGKGGEHRLPQTQSLREAWKTQAKVSEVRAPLGYNLSPHIPQEAQAPLAPKAKRSYRESLSSLPQRHRASHLGG